MARRLTVLQHNVLHWGGGRKISLANTYLQVNPDVILLNSTGIPDSETIKIYPYYFYQQNRSGGAHDGVAIGVRRDIRHRITRNYLSETLSVTLETAQGDVTFATSYLPPSRKYLPMHDYGRLVEIQHPCYIIGDLNAHHRSFGHNGTNKVGKQINEFINRGELSHLGPTFKTWLGHNAASTPDIILANRNAFGNTYSQPGPAAAVDVSPGRLNGSDHVPIVFTLSSNPLIIPIVPRFFYKEANWEGFAADMARDLQQPQLDQQPVEEIEAAVEHFYTTIISAKENNIPKKAHKIQPHPRRSNLLTFLERQLDNLRKEAEVNGWSREKFRQKMKFTRDIIAENKRLYMESWGKLLADIAESRNDPKIFWARVKRLRGTVSGGRADFLRNSQGVRVFSDEEREEVMREAWAPIFVITEEQNAEFDQDYEQEVDLFLQQRGHELATHDQVDLGRLGRDNLYDAPFTADDIKRKIKSFRNGRAPGPSGITKEDLAHLPAAGLVFLATIFTACLSTGYFPKKFKQAKMIFIPKPEKSATDPMNYRPISLLEIPGKVLEKLINERIVEFAETTPGVHDPNQYGFRPHKGTDMALAVMWELVALHLAHGGAANIITRDIQKAFDRVWHDGLRKRLLEVNLPNSLARIASGFLEGRTAFLQVHGAQGPPFPLLAGVPQGSCLSPTLFILGTSDTPPPNPRNGSTHVALADDHTQLVLSLAKAPASISLKTTRAFVERNVYEKERKITNALDKTNFVTPGKTAPHPLVIEGVERRYSQKAKILGLRLTNRGLTDQVTHLKKKATGTMSQLRRFYGLPRQDKLRLFKAIILPMLTYPAAPLNIASRSALLSLQRVQSNGLRWVHGKYDEEEGDRRLTNEALHAMYRMEPLNHRIHRLARGTWERLEREGDANLARILLLEDGLGDREQAWFRRSRPRALGPRPPPLLIQEQVRI